MLSVRLQQVSLLSLILLVFASAFAGQARYPKNPDPQLTPGTLCENADAYRYPERIKYCNRNVKTSTKYEIIDTYDKSRGFQIRQMDRQSFKIDHFIPLCMGGSNDRDNLWPQHVSVYNVTDPMEPLACQRMAEGKLSQSRAIELIKSAKLDLSQVSKVMRILTNL